MKRISQVSKEAYKIGKELGWDEFVCCHGYAVFDCDYPTDFGYIDGEHIERIDDMDVWNSDEDAAKHAEEIGFKIVRDIPGLPPVFIDTPKNRAKIQFSLDYR